MILRDDRELFERPAIEFLPNAVEGATAGGSIRTELSPQLGYGLVNRSLAVKADNRLPHWIVVPAIREPEAASVRIRLALPGRSLIAIGFDRGIEPDRLLQARNPLFKRCNLSFYADAVTPSSTVKLAGRRTMKSTRVQPTNSSMRFSAKD